MNTQLRSLIEENPEIFWDIAPEAKTKLSEEAVFTRILEFGDMDSFKKLIKILGKNTKEIYNSIINKKRINLSPRTINFMNTYFEYNP